ncbi:DNA alkylation repair protein [Actinophytocola algeriensis]|uniref:3-methyladenine DNA glycosylase AlkD n=1 Tax=Actinophytocola algeriensis TaxID=1768010 RepID=A0A7W7QA16_9PSEU|nr:DNA alkylation repair protein [Actinophytocola algeriensis]MBB4909815.1 3-methyladenine DNA glycosylase AlkD [Actinophytocola algeriensis]MBE1475805.1 3-methyladenine DNA glycosylase AlkD [Actinophytocola algeriensis]
MSALQADLRAHATAEDREKTTARLPEGYPVIGVRMKTLFDVAKAHSGMPLDEVSALFDEPEYEARLAAVCVLDIKARAARLPADDRRALCELYLARHDRIDTWDMVDRAAPRVVGQYLMDRPHDPLFTLARSANPHERRTAITAPLYWARYGTPAHLPDLFRLAEALLGDDDVVVAKPVGIALKYAGVLDEPALLSFLETHAARMRRPALRYAVEKLAPAQRSKYGPGR